MAIENLFFLGITTFIIPFVSSFAVTLNLAASALLGGIIAVTVTITVVWFLSRKYERALKKLDSYTENLKKI